MSLNRQEKTGNYFSIENELSVHTFVSLSNQFFKETVEAAIKKVHLRELEQLVSEFYAIQEMDIEQYQAVKIKCDELLKKLLIKKDENSFLRAAFGVLHYMMGICELIQNNIVGAKTRFGEALYSMDQLDATYVITIASLYTALCGSLSQDSFFIARDIYQDSIAISEKCQFVNLKTPIVTHILNVMNHPDNQLKKESDEKVKKIQSLFSAWEALKLKENIAKSDQELMVQHERQLMMPDNLLCLTRENITDLYFFMLINHFSDYARCYALQQQSNSVDHLASLSAKEKRVVDTLRRSCDYIEITRVIMGMIMDISAQDVHDDQYAHTCALKTVIGKFQERYPQFYSYHINVQIERLVAFYQPELALKDFEHTIKPHEFIEKIKIAAQQVNVKNIMKVNGNDAIHKRAKRIIETFQSIREAKGSNNRAIYEKLLVDCNEVIQFDMLANNKPLHDIAAQYGSQLVALYYISSICKIAKLSWETSEVTSPIESINECLFICHNYSIGKEMKNIFHLMRAYLALSNQMIMIVKYDLAQIKCTNNEIMSNTLQSALQNDLVLYTKDYPLLRMPKNQEVSQLLTDLSAHMNRNDFDAALNARDRYDAISEEEIDPEQEHDFHVWMTFLYFQLRAASLGEEVDDDYNDLLSNHLFLAIQISPDSFMTLLRLVGMLVNVYGEKAKEHINVFLGDLMELTRDKNNSTDCDYKFFRRVITDLYQEKKSDQSVKHNKNNITKKAASKKQKTPSVSIPTSTAVTVSTSAPIFSNKKSVEKKANNTSQLQEEKKREEKKKAEGVKQKRECKKKTEKVSKKIEKLSKKVAVIKDERQALAEQLNMMALTISQGNQSVQLANKDQVEAVRLLHVANENVNELTSTLQHNEAVVLEKQVVRQTAEDNLLEAQKTSQAINKKIIALKEKQESVKEQKQQFLYQFFTENELTLLADLNTVSRQVGTQVVFKGSLVTKWQFLSLGDVQAADASVIKNDIDVYLQVENPTACQQLLAELRSKKQGFTVVKGHAFGAYVNLEKTLENGLKLDLTIKMEPGKNDFLPITYGEAILDTSNGIFSLKVIRNQYYDAFNQACATRKFDVLLPSVEMTSYAYRLYKCMKKYAGIIKEITNLETAYGALYQHYKKSPHLVPMELYDFIKHHIFDQPEAFKFIKIAFSALLSNQVPQNNEGETADLLDELMPFVTSCYQSGLLSANKSVFIQQINTIVTQYVGGSHFKEIQLALVTLNSATQLASSAQKSHRSAQQFAGYQVFPGVYQDPRRQGVHAVAMTQPTLPHYRSVEHQQYSHSTHMRSKPVSVSHGAPLQTNHPGHQKNANQGQSSRLFYTDTGLANATSRAASTTHQKKGSLSTGSSPQARTNPPGKGNGQGPGYTQ